MSFHASCTGFPNWNVYPEDELELSEDPELSDDLEPDDDESVSSPELSSLKPSVQRETSYDGAVFRTVSTCNFKPGAVQ